jgi:hypothetical protein
MQVRRQHARSSDASSTTAPAPSANRIAVVRSVKSVMRDSVSEPTTSARRDSPARTNLSATDSAYMKLLQAASTLNAGPRRAAQPRLQHRAAFGNTRSASSCRTR